MPSRDREVRAQVEQIEARLGELETLAEPARTAALETVQALLGLYGEALARVMEHGAAIGGAELTRALVNDELISHLLLVHDLHPASVEARVTEALESVRPYLRSHGGNVDLLGVEEGVVRLRMQGSCSGCPSSAMTLQLAIEGAIHKAAPEVERIDAEGVAESQPGLVQLGGPRRNGTAGPPDDEQAWTVAGALPQLAGGGVLLREIAGEPVLFVKLGDTLFAYRHACPACGESLERGALAGAELACPGCGQRYDVHRAGRCLDAPQLYLPPIPLLMADSGIVKIALAGEAGSVAAVRG